MDVRMADAGVLDGNDYVVLGHGATSNGSGLEGRCFSGSPPAFHFSWYRVVGSSGHSAFENGKSYSMDCKLLDCGLDCDLDGSSGSDLVRSWFLPTTLRNIFLSLGRVLALHLSQLCREPVSLFTGAL